MWNDPPPSLRHLQKAGRCAVPGTVSQTGVTCNSLSLLCVCVHGCLFTMWFEVYVWGFVGRYVGDFYVCVSVGGVQALCVCASGGVSACRLGSIFLIQKDTGTPMFAAALVTIAKTGKPPKCPLTEEWIKKMRSIYTMEYDSAIKKDEIMPHAATWMQLEILIRRKVSQPEKDVS